MACRLNDVLSVACFAEREISDILPRLCDRAGENGTNQCRQGAQLEIETDLSLVERARRLLGESWLFRGLQPGERNALFARVRIRLRNFAAGETIFLKGSPGDHMMAVLSGTVRISVASAGGRALVLATLISGELFGEIALLDGKERTADAIAATECSLAILDRTEILSFLERYPATWPSIVAVLCDRLRKTDEHLTDRAPSQLPAVTSPSTKA